MSASSKLSPIVPTAHLHLIEGFTRYMALVHMLEDKQYASFYEEQAARPESWVILDNSTVELGEPFEMSSYLAAAIRLNADEILLPDWLHEKNRTLRAAETGLKAVDQAGFVGSVMGVPQGGTQAEWIQCLREMFRMGITSIGISKRYLDRFGQSRLFACYSTLYIAQRNDIEHFTIHLLGGGYPPEVETAPCLALPYVVGCDSKLPSHYSKAGYHLTFNSSRPDTGPMDFDEVHSPVLLRENIAAWVALCSVEDYRGADHE